VAKRKKDDDEESVESINAVETQENPEPKTIEQLADEMKDVDAQLSKFNFSNVNEVDV